MEKVNPNLDINHIAIFLIPISLPFLLGMNMIQLANCLISHYHQQGEPFLQLSAPDPIVIEPTREDGLALKLEALA